jgi:glycosyltransferase involved in cell wall biosynthesis
MERRPEGREHYLEALARARIFLFPTKVETFGLVLPEAMAAGCAIVSTSPLPFEGVRIGQDDVDGASKAVRALWDDPALCARCGKANQQIARQYDWNRYADELEQIYWRVIDARGGRA